MTFSDPVPCDNRGLRNDPNVSAYFDNDPTFKPGPHVKCQVCDVDNAERLFENKGFEYVQCQNCTHAYIANRPTEIDLVAFYGSKASSLGSARRKSPVMDSYWRAIYAKYLEVSGIADGNLLDVGCGDGHFLKYVREYSLLKPFGLEIKEGHDYVGRVQHVRFGTTFSLITLWGVLEHLSDPVAVFEKLHKICTGKMIVLVPNLFSRAFNVLGMDTPTLTPAHISFFTWKSMERLCDMTGFRIQSIFQELPVIDLMHDRVICDDALTVNILTKDESYYHVYVLRKV